MYSHEESAWRKARQGLGSSREDPAELHHSDLAKYLRGCNLLTCWRSSRKASSSWALKLIKGPGEKIKK